MAIFFKEGVRWIYGLFGMTIFFSALGYLVFRSERAGLFFSLSFSGAFYFLLMWFLTSWIGWPEKWRLSFSLFFPFIVLILLSALKWQTRPVMPLASVRVAEFWYLPGAWVRESLLRGLRRTMARWKFSPQDDLQTHYRNPDASLHFLDATRDSQGRLLLLVEIDNREAGQRFLKLYRLFSDGKPDLSFALNKEVISFPVSTVLLGREGEILLYSKTQAGVDSTVLLVFHENGSGMKSYLVSGENKEVIKLHFSPQGQLYGLERNTLISSKSPSYALLKVNLFSEGNLKLEPVMSLNWQSLLGNNWSVLDFYFSPSGNQRWFVLKQGERAVDYLLENQNEEVNPQVLGSQQISGPFPDLYEPRFLADGSIFLTYRDPLFRILRAVEMISSSGKSEKKFLKQLLPSDSEEGLLNLLPLDRGEFFAIFHLENLSEAQLKTLKFNVNTMRMGVLMEGGRWMPFYAENSSEK